MVEKLFKSLTIKIAAGAIVLVVIIFGLFLLGRKPSQSSIQETRAPAAKKIPKLNQRVEPSVKKASAKIPSSEIVPETTIEEKIPLPDETLLNSENPFEPEEGDRAELITVKEPSEREDKAGAISVEETSEKEGMAASIPVEERSEEGEMAESIPVEEPSEGGEKVESISVHETDESSGVEAAGEIADEEPANEAGLRALEKPEVEKPAEKEQPETETVIIDKKSSLSEHKGKRIIRDIVLSESGSEQKLVFQADSPIRKYKYFILSNPPRLVVDLPGVWKDPDFLEKIVDSKLISRIRLWNHGDKLRIVNDLKSDKALFPVFTKSSDGVEVVLKTR